MGDLRILAMVMYKMTFAPKRSGRPSEADVLRIDRIMVGRRRSSLMIDTAFFLVYDKKWPN